MLKYAEYVSRNAFITFTQEQMPYFRLRMVQEIVKSLNQTKQPPVVAVLPAPNAEVAEDVPALVISNPFWKTTC
jgi:hypothetical protein